MDYRDSLIQGISDMSKDLNGIRHYRAWHKCSTLELEVAHQTYKDHLAEENRDEIELEDMCSGKFDRRLSLARDLGARDTVTAIRWIIEGDLPGAFLWDAFRSGDQETYYHVETALLSWGLSMSRVNSLMRLLKQGIEEYAKRVQESKVTSTVEVAGPQIIIFPTDR
tara:strand:- start:1908 stop:2408 length:501 start_codon:yes stop_codon:yes gene_type:complete